MVGEAAAEFNLSIVLVAGIAGMVEGAMTMVAGEYVSVSSQADTEGADLNRERGHLVMGVIPNTPKGRHQCGGGLKVGLARQVVTQ